ncbi:hypothetical protein ANCCAN_18493 [Ancylostoma caninum]|uniref:Uncharacterized protein n=1 Tax=Ancylostoma caninum TaxID=29170 RepID=A0A368FU75_ANCCA|nr:hypothetical protein ANCCAN_18493 [Ancylostoma caninum]
MRKILVRDRLKWKAKLFKALQRALKDIRGYTCCDSGSGFRWIPNNNVSCALLFLFYKLPFPAPVKSCPKVSIERENRITDDEFENELEFHY